MFGFLEKETFPWWYSLVKWGLPLGLALGTGVGAGLMLTGTITMPAFFGMLKWGPAFFSTLEGFTSIAALGAITTAIASTVGVLTSFILRGTVLFPLVEVVATNSQRHSDNLKRQHEQEKIALQDRLGELTTASDQQRQEYETALNQTEDRLREVTAQYHQLRGMRAGTAGKLDVKAKGKTKPSASNDASREEPKTNGKHVKLK